jgi:hypothetical protein
MPPLALRHVRDEVGDDGFDHPIAFGSRLLTPAVQHDASVEGECLALVSTPTGGSEVQYFLHGMEWYGVYRPCEPEAADLKWLQTTRFSNRKVERWALRL